MSWRSCSYGLSKALLLLTGPGLQHLIIFASVWTQAKIVTTVGVVNDHYRGLGTNIFKDLTLLSVEMLSVLLLI